MQSDSGSSRATSGGALRRRYAASATSTRISKIMMMVALVRLGMQGPVSHPHQSRNDSIRIRSRSLFDWALLCGNLGNCDPAIWGQGARLVRAGVAQLV